MFLFGYLVFTARLMVLVVFDFASAFGLGRAGTEDITQK
jgi:hypothetical protein